MSLFSAIVPCYNEEENIDYFYQEFMKNEPFFRDHDLEFELLYVDDGSKDKTVEKVKELRRKDERVHLISFSRNFGKEAAMYAGLEHAKGDYVAVMDADLQDPPSLLPEMFGYLWDGYDQAATRRVTRKGEPPIRSFFARQFYKLINKFSKTEIVDGARDFRLMKRCVVDAILSVKEYNRFSKGIFEWVGFKTRWIEFENVERKYGETKWSFWKLFVYSIEGITSFSTAPLALAALMGVLFCRRSLLCHCVPDDRFCHYPEAYHGRSDERMAEPCVHHSDGQRHSAAVSWRDRAVFVQDLSGSKESPDLYHKGRA